ncbi:abortive infection family protein [Oceaniovalibus sp. ACAM 378]|uniref:abortive infection family protein n=1 Tax=Oceaniovalibus sp. ACAM 378 TaxID=2599923 RepID=UPI0011D6382D|nr:abortive infection family protein [Oceaniovalibus sp. ACAM 378]TYB89573.1 abortive infection family protein [Oceaniovalibus sp. ACAM 378]
MEDEICTLTLKTLRTELASEIANFKAYDVPAICVRIGLSEGSEEEAFQSKHKYAQKRIAAQSADELLKSARLLHAEQGGYALGEVLAKLDDLKGRPITKLTRRRLIKLFDGQPLATEVEQMDFIRSVWPIEDMPVGNGIQYDNLESFLVQHTLRNDDLTQQELMEYLGLLECSTSRLFRFLEAVTSAEYQAVKRQSELAKAIDQLLRHDGYALVKSGTISGSPLFKVRHIPDGSPSDNEISIAIKNFETSQVSPRWQAALESRSSNPERSITLARTLLEDVCKWILHEAGDGWDEADDLPALYKKTAKVLNLAPDDHTEQIFKQILGSCQSVVSALGALRNKLGDAHSIGPKRVRPAARHAELAVNLAGTMSTFLIATWANKNDNT